jgi:PHD/YefM family antitoxin component YafN of YafNO toxin-antitoxin module
MKTISISEVKSQMKDLIERVSQNSEIYYVTRYNEAKAVMMGVAQYKTLLQRIEQLEEGLAKVWTVLSEGEVVVEEPVMLPTPDGRWRPFRPTRPVSPETLKLIRRAAQIAWERRDWTPEMTVEAGRRDMERARIEAIARGIAIEDEREAAVDD